MKLCMMSYTMARQSSPEEFDIPGMCELAIELGMDAVDFVGTYGREPYQLRQMMDDYGLKVVCYTFAAELNFPTPEERLPGVDTVKQGIETAGALGADKIMVVTPGKEGLTREESRHNFTAGFAAAMPAADDAGITITIENFPGYLSPFVTSDDFLEAVRELPDLRLTFDNGNVFTGGEDPALSFERSQDYVVHAHFKDWRVVGENEGLKALDGRSYRGDLIGEALVDHRSCLAAMHRAGYSGYIDIEYEGDDYVPEVAVRKAHKYLTELIAEITATPA